MREHEVPTHVQAEDRVLLWFTFPQIVAITAVCALSYGAYRYAPGASEVRMALAIVMALAGIAVIVGKVGGRRLPLVAADLLRFGLGPRCYAGPPADLARSEPPAPPSPVRTASAARGRRSERSRRRRWTRRLRRPFRPHGWFGKRRRRRRREHGVGGGPAAAGKPGRRWKWLVVAGVVAFSAAALAAMSLAAPPPTSAQEPEPKEFGLWDLGDEIEFEPREPVPGRRLYFEELRVAGDRAYVTLRAATDLEIRVRAFGGLRGRELRFWSAAALVERETISYSLPLAGDEPSLTLSWEDGIGQGGAVTVTKDQIPFPLPSVDGELCDIAVTSLGWTTGLVEGVVSADCVTKVDEVVKVWTVVGHDLIGADAVIESRVTGITGTVTVTDGGFNLTLPFVEGETSFRLPVAAGEVIRSVEIGVEIEATLQVPMPDLVRLTHHPERTEYRTETVSLWRPGTGRTVSRTVTVTHGDGTTTSHTISAYLSVPGATVTRNVTLTIEHEEHVRAVVEPQLSIERSRQETLALTMSVGADAPFRVMAFPEPEPEMDPAEQRPVTAEQMSELFGWH